MADFEDFPGFRREILDIDGELARKLALLEFLSRKFAERGLPPPIVVGGCAVEIYTSGKYMSVDIDILAPREPFLEILSALGFAHEENGHGGILFDEELGIVVDWQGGGTEERVLTVRGATADIRVIGIDDLVVNRLCAAKFWKDRDSLLWAEILLRLAETSGLGHDPEYLRGLATKDDVTDLLDDITSAPETREEGTWFKE